MTHAHPLLSTFQNVWDLVDPVAHGRHLVAEPHPGIPAKHVLMPSGVRDGYFHPRAEAAFAVAAFLPLAGEAVEEVVPGAQALRNLAPLSYPVEANLKGRTAVMTQWAAQNDKGHYVIFNQPAARAQYLCFLAGVGATPRVAAAGCL